MFIALSREYWNCNILHLLFGVIQVCNSHITLQFSRLVILFLRRNLRFSYHCPCNAEEIDSGRNENSQLCF
jgi:hypothetical protein